MNNIKYFQRNLIRKLICLTAVFLSLTISGYGQTYFSESFENAWYLNGDGVTAPTTAGPNAPQGWTQTRVVNNVAPGVCNSGGPHDWGQSTWSTGTTWASTSSYPTGCAPYNSSGPTIPPNGTKALWFYDGWTLSGNTRLITSPAINLSAATNPLITFSYSYAQNSTSLTLVGSLDGGTTWNTLATLPATTVNTWANKTLLLPAAYLIANAKIGFQMVSTYGSYDAFVDNVVVREPALNVTATAMGGLWSSPATWVGGIVPDLNVTIPAGSVVTVDQVVNVGNLTINGTLQWNGSSNALTALGDITIGTTGSFLPYTTGLTGQTINMQGNLTNNGYANLACASTLLNFNGSQVTGGSTSQTLGGTGTFQGDGVKGLVRSLFFQTTGSSTINTTQNLCTTSFATTAGSLNTNGKLSIDNTCQIYGLALNKQVNSLVVTGMGVGYSVAPVVFGTAVTQYASGLAATVNTRYVSGTNVYLCTVAGTFTSAPTQTTTIPDASNGPTLLYLGQIGTLGNPFQVTAVTAGTQYFYGGNLYTCTVAGTPSATAPPTHTSGEALSGATVKFLYVGTPAMASVNYDATTQTVRNLYMVSAGDGYVSAPSIAFSVGVAGGTGSGAAATATFIQQIIGPANSLTQRSGSASITGGLNINSNQNATAFSGVAALSTSGGGVNYTVAPTVGFAGPTAINLVTNGGSGFTSAPTITVTGGNLVTSTALASSNFTITVAGGKVVSVYLNSGTSVCYSTPPTLTITGGGGTGATLAFPTGCWPTANAVIGSNGQLLNFNLTNSGYGYIAAPTCAVGTTSGTANGGTFTTVATAPTARIALYNYTINNFTPSPANVAATDDAAIPANRKINNLTLGSTTPINGFLNLSGNLEVFNSAPLTINSGILDMGGYNLLCSYYGYAGTVGSSSIFVKNGSVQLSSPGGNVTRSFPFAGIAIATGTTGTAAITGSTITSMKVTPMGAPSGTLDVTGSMIGTRTYRVQTPNAGETYGATPQATMTYVTIPNTFDVFPNGVDNTNLIIAHSTVGITGPWKQKSVVSGTGALSTTATKATATASPGPVVPGSDDYYTWASTVPICNGAPGIPTVSTGSSAVCQGSALTLTATGITTAFGLNYQWQSSTTAGGPYTNIAGATGSTYTTSSLSTGNYYFVLKAKCANTNDSVLSNEVNIFIDGGSITNFPSGFCGTGGNDTLTFTPNTPFSAITWSSSTPTTTITPSGNIAYANLSQTSTITATVLFNSGASCAFNASVGVYPLPTATVSTTANGVCPGTSATINSGLGAGNFSATIIPFASITAPGTVTNLCSGGTATVPLTSGTLDDGGWGSIPVGFNFNFFGTSYSTINVGTNGTLMFGTFNANGGFTAPYGLLDYSFTSLPSTGEPFNMVAVMANDNNLTSGSVRYWTTGIAPNRKFIVEYFQAPQWNATSNTTTAQAIFYETIGVIEVHVTSSNSTNNKVVGINNGNGTIGAMTFSSTNAVTTPIAWRFSPPSNYTTVWTAINANGTSTIASGTNIFTQSVAPAITTTYNISYTNQTTGCTNALGSAQVTMTVLGTVAPTGVNAIASATTVCNTGGTVNLSTDYTGLTDGLTYQWQVSIDGGQTWNNISGATALTYTATQSVPSMYQCMIASCNGTPAATSAVSVGTSFLYCYCPPVSTCVNEGILNVTFNTLNNSSAFCANSATGYSDYKSLGSLTSVAQGQNVPISVNAQINSNPASTAVWIDYNHSGTFDASEFTLIGTTNGMTLPNQYNYTNSVYIPSFALTGVTAMRVRQANQGGITSGSACPTPTVYGEYEDYLITINQGTPCSGQPVAGTASGPSAICPNVAFTLTDNGFTNGVINLNFQWQSNSGTGWTNIAGATTNTYSSTGITSATSYRMFITCTNSGMSDSSNVLAISVNSFLYCYCTPSGVSSSYGINNFSTIGGNTNINNLNSGYSSNGYGDYTSNPNMVLTASNLSTVSFSASYLGSGYTYGFAIFIDFNHNGSFADVGENVFNTTGYATSATGSFTIPANAPIGNTRMRIVANYFNSNPSTDYCATGIDGEFEDYILNVPVPCSGTPNPTTVSAPASVCPGGNATFYGSGGSGGAGITYQWESSPAGLNTWTPISGATSSSYSTTVSSVIDLHLITTCTFGGGTDISNTATVGLNPFYVCYCGPNSAPPVTLNSFAINYLTNVQILGTTLNNTTTSTTGYSLYYPTTTSTTTDLTQSIQYTLQTTHAYTYYYSSAWIDYNQNGVYDATEYIPLTTGGGGASTIASGTFTVPLTAVVGPTGMRVRMYYVTLSATDACTAAYDYETEDYVVNIAQVQSCAGTPATGVISGNNSVCSGSSFTLTATGVTQALGIFYHWEQYNSTTGIWDSIAGATNTYYTTTATTPTDYRFVTTCVNSGLMSFSNTFSISLAPFYSCYCASYATYTSDEEIWNVTIGSLNNSSTCATVAPGPGSVNQIYSNYTTLAPTTDTAGTNVPFSIWQGYCGTYPYGNVVAIYVDFNQNGSYSDPGENVYTSPYGAGVSVSAGQVFTGTFQIPYTAASGVTGLRVVCAEGTAAPPCGTYGWGETEDYTINIIPSGNCFGTPGTPVVNAPATICPNNSLTLSDVSGNPYLAGTIFQWEKYDSTASAWVPITGATGSSYIIASGITASTTYHLVVSCTNSGLSATSNAVSVIVNQFYTCYCPATNQAGSGSLMDEVNFGGVINNTSANNPSAFPAYSSFPSVPFTATAGASTPLTVTVSAPGIYSGAIVSVWIDYNHNGIFAANEWQQVSTNIPGGTSTTIQVNIPVSSLYGNTGMRIRSRGAGNPNGSTDACTAMGSGETEDYVVNILAPPPCTGTPSAGTASSTTSAACPNTAFTINDAGATIGLGIAYQWQSSPAGLNQFGSIVGATSNTLTVSGITTATDYQLVVTCSYSNSTVTSNIVSIGVNSYANCYCIPTVTVQDELITNTTFNGVSNPNTGFGTAGYQDFTSLSPIVIQASNSYPFSANISPFYGGDVVAVWIDFNHDGQFANPGERVFLNAPTTSPASGTIAIPATALAGITRMRVRLDYANGNPAPCGNTNYGNIEDYLVNITAPCAGIPNTPVASVISPAACIGGTVQLNATNISNAGGINNQWMVSTVSGGPYANVIGGTGATTSTYTTGALSAGTNYYILKSICNVTGDSSISNEVAVTPNTPPTVSITPSNGGNFCGTGGILTATGANTYVWSPATSLVSATGATVTSTATANTTFTVTGTDVNGCTNTATQAIIYSAPPAINVTASTASFCGGGGSTTLTASSTASYTYTFTALDGAVLSNQTANSVTAAVSQTSAILVSGVDNNGCNGAQVYSVGVYPYPTATLSTTASNVCPGTTATINTGLSAGNFAVSCITPATSLSTVPSGATTLANANAQVTTLTSGSLDDGYWNARPIGFTFNYFGNTYSTINIGTNGTLNFGATGSSQYNFTGGFPNASNPANTIAACARDLNFSLGGSLRHWTEGYAPNRRFVVQYANVPTYNYVITGGITGTQNVEVVLYETTGLVDIRAISASNGNQTVTSNSVPKYIGLQDATQTIGATAPDCSNSTPNYWNGQTAAIASPQAWRFTPPANYNVTWYANGNVLTSGQNVFTQTVSPSVTTNYSIVYTNILTGCTNAVGSAQVTMQILGTVAPSGVNTITNLPSVCAGSTVNLSTDYTGAMIGLTFQWQLSTDGGNTWTDISGATNITASVVQSVPTTYQCVMKSCGGLEDYSSAAFVDINGFYVCYCASSAAVNTKEDISQVIFGTLNNSSTCSSLAPGLGSVVGMYSNYTGVTSPIVNPGQVVPFTVKVSYCSATTATSNKVGIYIDYNRNGTYDVSELAYTSTYAAGTLALGRTLTGNITVPMNSSVGLTGMRVIVNEGSTVSPCGTYTNGETEDYVIDIQGCLTPTVSITASNQTICAGTSVNFTAMGVNGGNGATYQWLLNGSTISGATGSTYSTTSLQDVDVVSVQYTSACPSGGSALSNDVIMSVIPIAQPSVYAYESANSICAGTSVTFTAVGDDGGSNPSYQWYKNSNAISGATQATYTTTTLSDNDMISVVMTTSATCYSSLTASSAPIAMVVYPYVTPTVAASTLNSSVCAGTVVLFTSNSTHEGSAPTYQWYVNNSAIAGATNSDYYALNGVNNGDNYSVQMTSNDNCLLAPGASSNPVSMSVFSAVANVTASGPLALCNGGNVTLTADAASTYSWSNGATTQSITVSTPGTYSVTITSSLGCVAVSSPIDVLSKTLPATLKIKTLTTATTVCEPATVGFRVDPNANSLYGFSFQWNLNGSPISGATDSAYTATAASAGNVTLTIAGSTCNKTSVLKAYTIKPKPVADFSAAGPTTFCAGGSVTLVPAAIPSATYSWFTISNGAYTASAASSPKVVKAAGVYIMVAKLNGCLDTASTPVSVVVNPVPTAAVAALTPIAFCVGDSCTMTATPTGASSYVWNNGTVNVTTTTPNYVSYITGTYKVTVTDMNGCVSKISSTSVKTKANPLPVTAITITGTSTVIAFGVGKYIKLNANPGAGATYQWYLNGTAITGATTKTLNATAAGTYTLLATLNATGCKAMSATGVTLTKATAKEETGTTNSTEMSFELSAYPNPVSDVLTINVRGIDEVDGTIQVMDFNGRLVASKEMKQASTTVDMTGYASGVYLVRYKDGEGRTGTIKITKQ